MNSQAYTGLCGVIHPASSPDDFLIEWCKEDTIDLVLPDLGLKDALNS